MRTLSKRITALSLFLCLMGSVALADNSKISPDLQPLLANPSNSINVIVQYNTPPQSAGDVIAVSNQPNVAYISLDRPLGGLLDYSAGAVNASTAWSSGLDGSGIGIAVIDSGIYSHPDLNALNSNQSRVVYSQSFIGGTLADDFGHGTHVAGIVAGNGSSSDKPGAFRTFKGIAPNANLIDLRVLDQNGASNDSVVIAALQQAVQLKQ